MPNIADPLLVFFRLRGEINRLRYVTELKDTTDTLLAALERIQPKYQDAYDKRRMAQAAPKVKLLTNKELASSQAALDAGVAARQSGQPYNNPHDEAVEPRLFAAYHHGYNANH